MTEYTYPECTTSAVSALFVFKKFYPKYRRADIECVPFLPPSLPSPYVMSDPFLLSPSTHRKVTTRALSYIHNSQRPDGSWFGSWGICFTYATMFALESLHLNGETYAGSERVRRACAFLRGKQKLDGGWGETYMVRLSSVLFSFLFLLQVVGLLCSQHTVSLGCYFQQSCVTGQYSEHPESLVVQTAWGLMGLIYAQYPERRPIEKAVKLIISRQLPVRPLYPFVPHGSCMGTNLGNFVLIRTAHGLWKRWRASSTKVARSRTRTSSSALLSGR